MGRIMLSKNFSLEELTRSYQAEKHGIVNKPTEKDIESLRHLCEKVLQPLRNFYQRPISISSGFRCKSLNKIVGGTPSSQHLRGEAVDLIFPNLWVALEWIKFISNACPFDQLLLERKARTGATWLHVSCCMDERKNRRQIKLLQVR